MRNGVIAAILTLTAGAGWAGAQAPLPPGSPIADIRPVPASSPADAPNASWAWPGHADDGKPRVWASAEYLMWWVKDSPLPYPLVTTGDPTTGNPGALNASGVPFLTRGGANYGTLSGLRVSLGGWLDADGTIGIEGSGFLLPQQSKTYRASSDANGNPVLAFRYLDPPVGGAAPNEDAFQASIPPGNTNLGVPALAGSLAVQSQLRLWGAEVNGVLGRAGSGNLGFQALAGFRYVDLQESLSLQLSSTALGASAVDFLGTPFGAPSGVATLDSFQTRNQFYGGQVGLRGTYALGNFSLSASGKVALGDNHESLNILGTSTLFPAGGASITVPTGQFAQPSNIGRRTRDEFAVIPEAQLNVGYQATRAVRVFVGYDFLYWSNVVRPGSQVDLIVNNATNATNPGFIPGTTQANYPRPLFNRSDFWAQGVNFGVEFRY